MKIVFDSKTKQLKVGSKTFGLDMEKEKEDNIMLLLKQFIHDNSNLDEYDIDSMWMSYRYCIGSHTIATHMRASDIIKHCYGRLSRERSIFNAFDMNREIERCMQFGKGPNWYFPITSLNRIYTSAIDIYCEFLEDYNIKSKEDYLKYKEIRVILTDNERGYKLETITWEEYLRPKIYDIVKEYMKDETEESSWNIYLKWKEDKKTYPYFNEKFEKLTNELPNPNYFFLNDIEDLFVWNDVVHIFDLEHHHKSVLVDGSEVEWFWGWIEKAERREDGYYYKTFGYERQRIPVDKWNGTHTIWIPEETIIKNLY